MSRSCFVIVEQAVSTDLLLAYKTSVQRWQATALETLREFGPTNAAARLPSEITKFAPNSAGINVDVSPEWGPRFANIGQGIVSRLRETLEEPVCNLDLSWLRTQFPPSQRPPHQAPHSWHQDGACGVDFNGPKHEATKSLAHMRTAWVPLVACGIEAPSIELVLDSPKSLLEPQRLHDPDAEWRKLRTQSVQLQAGDLVLMEGHCVHRTHVTEHMTQARDSVELRFLDQVCLPSRFRDHRLASVSA